MRSRSMIAAMLAVLALIALAAPDSALAHVPVLESKARGSQHTIPGGEASKAVYGILLPGELIDVWELKATGDGEIEIELLVPAWRDLEPFRPALAILGPKDMPEPVPAEKGRVDPLRYEPAFDELMGLSAAAGGAYVFTDPGREPRGSFFEPFSLQRLYRGPAVKLRTREGEVYRIVVARPGSRKGRKEYVLAMGGSEAFSGDDWSYTARALPRIWVGAYGGAPPRPGPFFLVVLVGSAVLILMAWGVWRLGARVASSRSARQGSPPPQ